ncbi:MAG: toxic anion resistance protein [Cardiobacteriales bacterium]|nr:MAG: toxic anion resistance protein [Cardiobacteriales bacterium]
MNEKNFNHHLDDLEQQLSSAEKPLDKVYITQLIASIDIRNTQSILNFGSQAQKKLTGIADTMLADVKSEDIGKAGALLNEMVGLLRGFKGSELILKRKPSFWDKLTFKPKPIASFLQRFDNISEQIDRISNDLERRKQQLLIDIKSLDQLYDANLNYLRDLEHYIFAAEQVINNANTKIIPDLEAHTKEGSMQTAQKLHDYQIQRDELERRLHDLQLTRQVAIQALPSIRMVQENNKGLVNKINATLVNTVPLWRQQLAQSIAIYRSGETAEALKHSANLTNELLTTNAESLKIANQETRKQFERGVFDIESVEKANQMLIETIEESIAIQETGRAQREKAAKRLKKAENQLKDTLKSASHNNLI